MLISTKPQNAAQAAALARAKQLSDFKWTPVRDVPVFVPAEGQSVLPAGVEVTGLPYSSTERTDKFFTENVSFRSFLSAIPNPYSKLYQAGQGAKHACSYGIVCNSFVRYALGIPWRVNTKNWFSVPGMRMVAPKEAYRVEEICLLDVLHAYGEGRNHVAIITDILRDAEGNVAEIEVSEAVPPHCKRVSYPPEEFYEKYKPFSLCRYDGLDEVPLLDEETDRLLWKSGIETVVPKITVDNGDQSNYLMGEEVLVSICAGEKDTVDLYRNGELISSHPVAAKAIFPLKPERGYYEARLRNVGDSVAFCVCRAEVSHVVHNGSITVHADPCDEKSRIVYADFRLEGKEKGVAGLVKYEVLTEAEKDGHTFSRTIHDEAKHFKVYYQNEYGIWTHTMTRI